MYTSCVLGLRLSTLLIEFLIIKKKIMKKFYEKSVILKQMEMSVSLAFLVSRK